MRIPINRIPEAAGIVVRGGGRHVRSYFLLRSGQPLKLHLGCGRRRFDGYINIDLHLSRTTDYVGDIAKLPCKPGTVERLESYHLIEHLPQPRVLDILKRWHRVMQPGGVIVVECPDFEQDIADLLAGNRERLYSIFGRQRFAGDAHHWGYTGESLCALLEEAGFKNPRAMPGTDYHAEFEPCIRVEAAA